MAFRIPDTVIDEISRRNNIVDVVGGYVNLNRKGDRWWGLCPFHTEKTPSFLVNPDSNLFYCFGCQKGGGVYQFLMEIEGLSFPEAVHSLAEKAGIEIPEEEGEAEKKSNRRSLEELYRRVTTTFEWLLANHKGASHARSYLEDRGLDQSTLENFRIGWAPADGEWLYQFLIGKKYSPEFLSESGLFSRKSPRWSYFVDRVMFPVMPDSERVVAFSGRALTDRGPKYINSPETLLYRKSAHLYGYSQARKSIRNTKRALLCEGNIDVLAFSQAGIAEVVAPLGTAFTEEQARLIKRHADTLILSFDGDDAGRAATMKSSLIAERAGLTVQVVKMPLGSDPADIAKTKGSPALKKTVERPINIFDYLLDFVISAHPGYSGEAQEEALEELTPYLEAVGSDVRREAYLRQLAETIKADPATVIREYRSVSSGKNRRNRIVADRNSEKSTIDDAGDELYLMTAVAVRTEYFPTLRDALPPELLRDKRALFVYRVLDELCTDGRIPGTDTVVGNIDDVKLKTYILEKAASSIYDDHAEKTISDKVRLLLMRAWSEERQELIVGLSQSDPMDPDVQQARIKRIQEIDREIIQIRQGEDGGNQV